MPSEGVKMGSLSKTRAKYNQSQQKCYPLEPVQEHSVAHHDEAPRKQQPRHNGTNIEQKRMNRRRGVLVRVRDWYVRVMNDMATSADLTGVSAMYGCSTGQVEYPGTTAMAIARRAREKEEMAENLQVDCKSGSTQK